jgi:hypothetical protein
MACCTLTFTYSLDGKKAQIVVDEITTAGGDAFAVSGDVGAEEFPKNIVEATIKCVFFLHKSCIMC